MTERLEELLARHCQDADARRAQAQDNVREVFQALLDEIPELQFVRMRGWTPGFNDGDPCVHGMSVMVDGYDPDEILFTIHEDYVDENDDIDVNAMISDHPELAAIRYPRGFSRQWNSKTKKYEDGDLNEFQLACIKGASLLYAITDDIQIVYGTDWEITLTRVDNLYHVELDEYDCGY